MAQDRHRMPINLFRHLQERLQLAGWPVYVKRLSTRLTVSHDEQLSSPGSTPPDTIFLLDFYIR
jgi:hypothetical protein